MFYMTRPKVERFALMNTKASIIGWGLAYLIYPPDAVVHELGRALVFVSAMLAIFGSTVGIIGLKMSHTPNIKRRYQGTLIEFSGLLIALGGPASFFVTIAYLTFQSRNLQGLSFSALAGTLCAFMISRLVVVGRYLKAM